MSKCSITSSRFSTKNQMIIDGAFTSEYEITDMNVFQEKNKEYSEKANNKYRINATLYSVNNNTAVPNESAFWKIDASNDLFYRENQHLKTDNVYKSFLYNTTEDPIQPLIVTNDPVSIGQYFIANDDMYIFMGYSKDGNVVGYTPQPQNGKEHKTFNYDTVKFLNAKGKLIYHNSIPYIITDNGTIINRETNQITKNDPDIINARNEYEAMLPTEDVLKQLYDESSGTKTFEEFSKIARKVNMRLNALEAPETIRDIITCI